MNLADAKIRATDVAVKGIAFRKRPILRTR